MKKIIMPRGSGKTTKLIQMSAETGKTIVCANQLAVSNILFMAKALKLEIQHPITIHDIINHTKMSGHNKYKEGVLIDEADLCLQHISLVPISAITLSEENK